MAKNNSRDLGGNSFRWGLEADLDFGGIFGSGISPPKVSNSSSFNFGLKSREEVGDLLPKDYYHPGFAWGAKKPKDENNIQITQEDSHSRKDKYSDSGFVWRASESYESYIDKSYAVYEKEMDSGAVSFDLGLGRSSKEPTIKSEEIGDKSSTTWADDVRSSLKRSYSESMLMSGGAWDDESLYYTNFNNVKHLPNFNPFTASNVAMFMTRPALNLTDDNIYADSLLTTLARTREGIMILQNLFNPFNAGDVNSDLSKIIASEHCMKYTPFIPLVSNLFYNFSGIKDKVMDKREYDGDFAGNKQIIAAGTDEYQGPGEVSITYLEDSMLGITIMTEALMRYIEEASNGRIIPSMQSIDECILDYMSSIYWFVLGQDGFSIKLYGRYVGVFPLNNPLSALVPTGRGEHVDPKITINYQYNHPEIMQPRILADFNHLVNKALVKTGSNKQVHRHPVPRNKVISDFYDDNFLIKRDDDDDKVAYKNKRYERTMIVDGLTVYRPGAQNQWFGHPVVTNEGKLVYVNFSDDNYRFDTDHAYNLIT